MKEIDINIEGYNVNGICVGCLNYNRKMFYRDEVYDCFKKLAEIDVPDGLSIQVCWECLAAVQSAMRFRHQIVRAYGVLQNYSKKHTFLNSPEDLSQYAMQRLAVHTPDLLDVVDCMEDVNKTQVEVAVKDELDEKVDFDYEEEDNKPDVSYEDYSQDMDYQKPDLEELSQDTEYPLAEQSSEDDIQLSELKSKRTEKKVKRKRKKLKDEVELPDEASAKNARKLKNLPEHLVELHTMSEEEMWQLPGTPQCVPQIAHTHTLVKIEELSDEDSDSTPPDIKKQAQSVVEELLPEKSKQKYLIQYNRFLEWQAEKKIKSLSEKVFLAYFIDLAKKNKPTTLWNIYSMLKCTIQMKHKVEINKYVSVLRLLKKQSDGYKCKKSKLLTRKNMEDFIKNAPDSEYLVAKLPGTPQCVPQIAHTHTLVKIEELSDEDSDSTPPDIKKQAQSVVEELLPEKSKQKYLIQYNRFLEWQAEKKIKSLSEKVFLAYFIDLAKKNKPTTLWNIYSMLKCTIQMKHKVEINKYVSVLRLLKKQSDGYKCKKSKLLTRKNMEDFIKNAPDSEYLVAKIRNADRTNKEFVKLKYKCEKCIIGFNTEKLMKDHSVGKHTQKPDTQQCDVCLGHFLSKDNLSAHRALHARAFRCKQCGLCTTLKRAMLRHARDHGAGEGHRCGQCGKLFATKSRLSYHKNVCHQEKPQCDCCGKVFANKMTLKYHLKILPQNKDDKPKEKLYLPCKGCGKVFHSKKSYRAHVVIHDGVSYPCPICGKLFQWKRNLARHTRAHREREAGARHECRECGKTFSSRDCLYNHMRLSKKHVPDSALGHQCNYCGKKFATKYCMVDHIDWDHLKRIKYQCSVCFKAFKTSKIMVAHMNNIHEGKRSREPEGDHLCDICGKSYKTVKRLKGHVWAMHTKRSSSKSFRCKYCPATFIWQSSVYKHIKGMHRGCRNKQAPRPAPPPPALKKPEPYSMQYFTHLDLPQDIGPQHSIEIVQALT